MIAGFGMMTVPRRFGHAEEVHRSAHGYGATLTEVVKKFKGSSQEVRRAQILLRADADGPAWTDAKIAEVVGCRTKTVENIRERFVTPGLDITLNGRAREQEARVIALRLGPPPKGFANWSLRLLAEKVVELEIVDAIRHETIRQTLRKAE